MPPNPAWAFDELVLALDLYMREPAARSSRAHPALTELSGLLRSLPLHAERDDPVRFRNRNSVYLKLQNFKTVDPNYAGAGMRAGAGPRERAVWARFANDPAGLSATALAIRDIASEPAVTTDEHAVEGDDGVVEGRLLMRLHRVRERRRSGDKKRSVLQATGRLACESCDFDFAAVYGTVGDGFAECHHKLPLAAGERRTLLSDLAIVCANCHRMLHRRTPWLTIDELRALLADRGARP